jgi:uncharacterized protein (TIGR02145 family)
MSMGTIEWAGSNLSGYQTFAESETDYGALFQWGYDNALSYQTSIIDGWHTTAYSGADWNGGRGPCPSGWRLPTLAELNNLINLPADNTTAGAGTPDGTWTSYSWTTGTSNGLMVTPKAGDTDKTLRLPNAGFRNPDGTASEQGFGGWYWSSMSDGTFAYRVAFYDSFPSGRVSASSKLNGLSVRCVRTV